MNQLEEERDARTDPDDPFNGTANGVFLPLQDQLSLPPPVQMPRRHENSSKNRETSQNLRKSIEKKNTKTQKEGLIVETNRVQGENILENRWIR